MQNFVGREEEVELFRRALSGVPSAPSVIVLHGPGGIGKSALLQRYAVEARSAGRPVVSVDTRTIYPSPAAFEQAATGALFQDDCVLMVDSFERCRDMEEWLRNRFLPRLPTGVLVVLAGRLPPGPLWRTDLGWRDLMRVVPLSELDADEAAGLLAGQGADPTAHRELLGFAGGNPLALRLAAEVAAHGSTDGTVWEPSRAVTEQLLSHLVGDLPSPAHRHALEICGHALDTTEDLLRVVLPEEDATQLFAWLRQLPFVRSGRYGVYPHDVIRDSLDSDFRWRDPDRYMAMHRAVRRHLVERIRNAPEREALRATGAYNYIISRTSWIRKFRGSRDEGGAYEDTPRPEEAAELVRMTREIEGEQSAAAVEYWLTRQPESFKVHRRYSSNELLGFMAWLRVEWPDADMRRADPVAAEAWDAVSVMAPPRHGEHVNIARFMVHRHTPHRPSRAWDLVHMRIIFELLRARHCAWSCVVMADPEFWEPLMTYMDMFQPPGRSGRTPGLFCHDWRAVRVDEWAEGIDVRLLGGQPEKPAEEPKGVSVALTRAEADAAVRDALRNWLDPDALAVSPLLKFRIIEADDGSKAVAALQEVLNKAVQRLQDNPRTQHLHAVLTMTFQSAHTQEAMARRLNMAFSTYRRYLTRAIDEVQERVWLWETQGHVPD
ncbi:ATP-binding protein [Streptomyces sp. AC555_RSS877]|uniref:ATP-binding protein n=1 Tax=Streptomyces sp. AC555_RSS877 TaxID=2823688 RepID=UPI0020B7FBC0|nr:ATP-binding protein [Streptomyces sp. AC555_RSS877]